MCVDDNHEGVLCPVHSWVAPCNAHICLRTRVGVIWVHTHVLMTLNSTAHRRATSNGSYNLVALVRDCRLLATQGHVFDKANNILFLS